MVLQKSKPVKITNISVPTRTKTKGFLCKNNVPIPVLGSLVTMGKCEFDADFEDITVVLAEKEDEALYIIRGSLRILWEDMEGNKGDITVNAGEYIYMPGGYKYTTKPRW